MHCAGWMDIRMRGGDSERRWILDGDIEWTLGGGKEFGRGIDVVRIKRLLNLMMRCGRIPIPGILSCLRLRRSWNGG
jgi:hypothetical protein